MERERWLTTTEVADALGVTRQTVSRWIRDGRLRARAIEVGSRPVYRVRVRDLRDFVTRYVHDLH